MRQLVCADAGAAALELEAFLLGAGQESEIAKGDEPGVLHRRVELRHRQQIELLVRVRDAEVLLEPRQELRRRLCGIVGLRRPSARCDDPDRRSFPTRLAGVHALERPHGQGHEIAGQRAGFGEADRLHPPRLLPLRGDRRVGERHLVLRDVERELPGDLEPRLIEAGEGAPGIERLELRVDVPVRADLAPEQPRPLLLGHLPPVGDVQPDRARTDEAVKGKTDEILAARHDASR